MISFQATDEDLAFVEVAKDFAKKRIRDQARDAEKQRKVDERLIQEAEELGFLSLELPEVCGGLELPLIAQVQILKALSYGDLGVVQGLPSAGDAASVFRVLKDNPKLEALQNRYQREQVLITALLDLADDARPWGKSLTITKNDSGFVLNGISEPTRLAQQAEVVAMFVRDQEGELVVLLLEQPNWTIVEGEYRLGLLAAGLAKLQFDHVFVSNDRVLASGEEAETIMKRVQCRNYILHAAKQTGVMEAALDYATEYTATRKAFGQEIAKFQGVSFKIAKMAMETRIVYHLTLEAALRADKNEQKAYGLALRALHRAHSSARFVTDAAVQLLGGHGFIQEYPVEKWMRDTQAQVTLYGREQDLLSRRGEALLQGEKEVSAYDLF